MGPGGRRRAGGSVLVVGGHLGFARGREVGETDGACKKRKCQCTKVPTVVQKYPKCNLPETQKHETELVNNMVGKQARTM